jgi:hypothetical protein
MSATAPRITPKAPAPVENQAAPKPKNVSRDGATAQRQRQDVLRAAPPLRENPSTYVNLTVTKHQPKDALIQTVQPPADLAPPTITLGRPARQVLKDQTLKKLESQTITSTGAPLPVAVKSPLAHSFSIDLTPIRVHTDARAQLTVRSFNTRAFAYGHHIFLGPGESPNDLRLMSHEVAHVVQQSRGAVLQHFTPGGGDALEQEAERASAAVMRGDKFNVQQRTAPRPQGFLDIDISIPDPLDWLAGKANSIPGFRMLTIILGVNPINMTEVDRSAANILRALVEVMPGGTLISQALDNHGIFEKAGAFVEEQINALGMTGSAIKSAVTTFIDGLDLPGDLISPASTWERAKKIFTDPIDRIKDTAVNAVTGIIEIIKDAILRPIAKLAEGTEGYNLLKGVLGEDPITGDHVDRSAETLLGPLLKMIGLGDVWQKMQEAKAIDRAWQWFQTTLSQLIGFVSEIPTLFLSAFKALTIEDIILVPQAFAKLAAIFGGFMGKFVSWGVDAMFKLLEIVFDVVSPGALSYVKKTGSAMKSIFQNPLPFVGNLVKAAKLGFQNFAGNFVKHLKAGLIDWLTGSLQGVYIPRSFALGEVVKFIFSVLGLTWTNVRQKLVKATSETIVQTMETGFDIVMTLVTQGPAAAWDKIQEHLSKLKDQVIQGIIDLVVDAVVTRGIPKLVAMFIPGAGFISAIISIYDTIMVFVNKISKIIQVVTAFINSIVAIAQGNIGAAATKVESILAGLLSLAINFIAGFAGLGKIASKIMGIVNKIRAPIDKALDSLVNWIVGMAKKLGKFLLRAGVPADPKERLRLGMRAAVAAANTLAGKTVGKPILARLLPAIQTRYSFKTLEVVPRGDTWAIRGVVNPEEIAGTRVIVGKDKDTGEETSVTIVSPPKIIVFKFSRFTAKQNVSFNEMTEGLSHHQSALNALTVAQWLANIYFRPFLRGAIAAEERDYARKILIQQLRAEVIAEWAAKGKPLSPSQVEAMVKLRARNKHASHLADFIAGGNIDEFEGLERGAVNSYVGSMWNQVRPDLEAYANFLRQQFNAKDREKVKMNFRLRAQFKN